MNGMAEEERSPANRAAGARRRTPNRSSAPVAATESRDPASRTFHRACRKAAPRANASAPPLMPPGRPRPSGVQRLLHALRLRSLDVGLLLVLLLLLVVHRLRVHRP